MTDEEAPLHASVADALYALQQEVGPLSRDATNPYYNSKFSSFPGIREVVEPIARKHGLYVRQSLRGRDVLRNRLYFNGELEDDEDIEMHLQSDNPQGHGSAITYYRRYAYTTCLGLVSAQDDDDGNAASPPELIHREAPSRPPVAERAAELAATHSVQSQKIDEDF